jgi:hypothetical protein
VREGPELEVLERGNALLEAVEHVLERLRPVDAAQPEGGHAAHGDRDHDAERAEGHARRPQQVAVRQVALAAVREHELDPLDLRREVGQRRAGAVRRGGDRAGERLDVDVPEVRQRHAAGEQLLAEPAQGDAGLHARQAGRGVALEHPVQPPEREQRPVGQRAAGEGVTRAGHADLTPGHGGARDRLGELGARPRRRDLGRRAMMRARPVRPRSRRVHRSLRLVWWAWRRSTSIPGGWTSCTAQAMCS